MNLVEKNRFKKLLFLFLVWPFLSFLTALNSLFSPSSQKIILLFSFMFGYTVYLYSGDILNYEESFKIVGQYSWEDYRYLITNLFSVDKFDKYSPNTVNTQPDPFAFTLQFLVSRFTDNPRWFWAIVSTFYTYTVLNLANFVYKENYFQYFKSSRNTILWLCFFLVIPFYVGVTGVRYWPALFLFVFFLLNYLKKRTLFTLLLFFIPVLIHYSFFAPVAFVIGIKFIPNRLLIHKISVVISLFFFFTSSFTTIFSFLNEYLTYVEGSQLEERLSSYTNEDLLEQRQEKSSGTNWYVSLRGDLLFYFLIGVNVLNMFSFLKFKETNFTRNFYHFFIFFMCLALITYNLGSIGRLKNVFILLACLRFVSLCYQNYHNKQFKRVTTLFFIIILFNTIVNFRAGFYYVDPFLLIHNSFTFLFVESDLSLSELLIGH